eukprot:506-Heterococcus_DN1.PRE.1
MFNEFPLAEIVHICAVKHTADMRIKLANYTFANHMYSEHDSDAAVKFQTHKKRKPLISTTA